MEINSISNNLSSPNISGHLDTTNTEVAKVDTKLDLKPKTTKEINEQNKEQIKETLTKAVKDLNKQMDILNTNITFGFNDKIDMMYVNVKEKSSGKLIRKFPTEEAMKLAEHMKEFVGIIFDKKG